MFPNLPFLLRHPIRHIGLGPILQILSLLSSHSVVSYSFQPYGLQHTRLPCPLLSPRACSNSCPSSWWCNPIISSSVIPFSACLQFCPASGSFIMSQFFTSGGQSIRASALASVLPMNIQDWFPLGLTGFTSLQSKELSRILQHQHWWCWWSWWSSNLNTDIQKHQFFGAETSLQSNTHIHTWLLEIP